MNMRDCKQCKLETTINQPPYAFSKIRQALLVAIISFSTSLQAEPATNATPIEAASFNYDAVTVDVDRTVTNPVMNLNHHVDRAVLDWQSFDIGKNTTVNFNQLSASSLTVNNINQASASQIFGQLNANGRVFLINQNGILFGKGSQVNVHELTASTLDINDKIIEDGILSPILSGEAAFNPFDNGQPSQKITIESGATLSTETGGRIFLFAPDIENNGVINTPEGQTILAAGTQVYLQASSDPSLRGLLVEVNSGGEVLNLGEIIADRGNITLAGLAINQNKRVSASSTVNANGSIKLIARDTVDIQENNGFVDIETENTGTVTLGDNSVTEILAELDNDQTAIDEQVIFNSRVEIVGEKIHLKENSLISAKGGEVEITAVSNPLQSKEPLGGSPRPLNDEVVVQMEAGSRIDVSGNSATLDMNRNNITVELRGNELRDLPLQRDGNLRGETVVLDIRRTDDFQLGDISGNLSTIERGIGEITAAGGTVSVNSEGSIRFKDGAEIDVSGGVITYNEGEIQTTLLEINNRLVDIHDADANIQYDGIAEISSRVESSYIEGKDAGNITLAAKNIIADGTLTGNTVAGRYQRTQSKRPKGGELIIGIGDGQGGEDYQAPNIILQRANLTETIGSFDIDINETFDDAGLAKFSNTLLLSTDFLANNGFTRVELNSNGNIRIKNSLELPAFSDINLTAESINVESSIVAPSGNISLQARAVNTAPVIDDISKEAEDINQFLDKLANQEIDVTTFLEDTTTLTADIDPGIVIDNSSLFDVSGTWVNDFPLVTGITQPDSAISIDAGSISLDSEAGLDIGEGVNFIALGGAQYTTGREFNYGDGGDIRISVDGKFRLGGNNQFLGHGVNNGGQFFFTSNAVSIEAISSSEWQAEQIVDAREFVVIPDFFFSESGFSSYQIGANDGDLIIQPGADLSLKSSNLFLPFNALNLTDTSMLSLLSSTQNNRLIGVKNTDVTSNWIDANIIDNIGFKPDFQRIPTRLDLRIDNVLGGGRQNLVLSEFASIKADPLSEINFTNNSGGILAINGSIDAPASNVNLVLGRDREQVFDDRHVLLIGDTADIDVSGTFVRTPNRFGLTTGNNYDAGNVNLLSSGFIITEANSVINAKGITTSQDFISSITGSIVTNQVVNTRAGNVSLRSAEGIVIDGDIDLSAAANAFGGELLFEVNRDLRFGLPENASSFSFAQAEITLDSNAVEREQQLMFDFAVGDSMSSDFDGKLTLSSKFINDTNTDSINLISREGLILLEEGLDLTLRRDVILDALAIQSLDSTAYDSEFMNISANYISIGSSRSPSRVTGDPLPTTGDFSLGINADLIDLQGTTAVTGFNNVNLNSDGDIRLKGLFEDRALVGDFSMVGHLSLTADQIYPTSLTEFTLDAGNTANSKITVSANNDNDIGTVLSAGGTISLNATEIDHDGVLRAPMGQINFNAGNRLTLSSESTTSVSAEGQTILLGQTLNELEWLYSVSGAITGNNTIDLYSEALQAMPEKSINLNGAEVSVEQDAIIDLTGGGDLLVWEFVPGPGGSADQLAARQFVTVRDDNNIDVNVSQGDFFAVLPSFSGDFAAFDTQESFGWDFAAGESVFLSAGNGLAAGNYVKLPARYSLLPGAFLVEQVDGFDNISLSENLSFRNGTLVAGYEQIAGTGIRSDITSGFIVRSGQYANQLSEFNVNIADDVVTSIATANDFALPRLTRDAGRLFVSASSTINLDGLLRTDAAEGGKGSIVDITADSISIVNDIGPSSSSTQLLAKSLNKLNAESLFIGGERRFTKDGTIVDVRSNQVIVENDVELSSPEILLGAIDSLSVESGVLLSGKSDSDTFLTSQESYLLDGDSSIVRVSTAPQATVTRTNTTGSTSLTIADNVLLEADQSILVDSSGSITSGARIEDAEEYALGASNISIGDVFGVDGLVLDLDALNELRGLDLVLRTSGDIRFYGTTDINDVIEVTLDNLSIDAAGLIADQDSLANFDITANKILIGNNSGSNIIGNIADPNGLLTLNASELQLSNGIFTVDGFSQVNVNTTDVFLFSGDGTFDISQGSLDVTTPLVTALSNTNYQLESQNEISFNYLDSNSPFNLTDNLGADLSISAQSISLDTFFDLPVGQLSLTASGDIIFSDQAVIDLQGVTVDVIGLDQINLPGGNLVLQSETGNIELRENSIVDVSSGKSGARAGSINIFAENGDVSILSELRARAPVNSDGVEELSKGGVIRIDADTIGQSSNTLNQHSFNDLNNLLNDAGFTANRKFRKFNGDINVGIGEIILSQNLKMVAENGSINIGGFFDAPDDSIGGAFEFIASDDITLDSAFLSVSTLTPTADSESGTIKLQAINGELDINTGSVFNLGEGGEAILRVARNAANNDLNIQDLNVTLFTGDSVILEAYKNHSVIPDAEGNISIDSGVISSALADATSFMSHSNISAINNRLGIAGDVQYKIRPGIDIQNLSGDITISSDINFASERFNAEPGILALRASGDVNIQNNISDGVTTTFDFASLSNIDVALSDDSWSYVINAGADRVNGGFSADWSNTEPISESDLIIGNDTFIRTGTGDIEVYAANDIVFNNSGSLIYTIGRANSFDLDEGRPEQIVGSGPSQRLVAVDGGDIIIEAGNNILGSTDPSVQTQLFNEWYIRQESNDGLTIVDPISGDSLVFTAPQDAGIWFDINSFRQGVAAIGGGDVTIDAGNNIEFLSVSAPTFFNVDINTQEINRVGKGNISISAANDIDGGIYFIGDGNIALDAGGDITSSRTAGGTTVNTVFGMTGGNVNALARGDIKVESIFNPTALESGDDEPEYFTFLDDTSASFTSINGDISIGLDITNLQRLTSRDINTFEDSFIFRTNPGALQIAAVQGNVDFTAEKILYPSSNGGFEIYAANNISLGNNPVTISDTLLSLLPTLGNSNAGPKTNITNFAERNNPEFRNDDLSPSYFVASNGNIDGGIFNLSEATRFYAGNDILDVTVEIQNNRSSDLSSIVAGRDFSLSLLSQAIDVSGPGLLEVVAGRNIDLGESDGIETLGNIENPLLSDNGAEIIVQAGVGNGAQYQAFYQEYFSEGSDYHEVLLSFLDERYDAAEITAFLNMSVNEQWNSIEDEFKSYLLDAFFSELRIAGENTNGDFSPGFNAIDTLFPESAFNRNEAYGNLSLRLPGESNEDYFTRLANLSDYQGDLSLFSSKIYTRDGGDITILVPGGFVNAGLASQRPGVERKPPDQLGVVAQSFGDIQTYSREDFLVNQERVSTLLGGDIIMWTSIGDIDAGRGSKTAVSAPEPIITFTTDGELSFDLSNTISGSGIRAVVVDPSVEAGNVDLIAPNGIVNAGDAGIASSGNININAVQVLGADNIQFGGVAVGVPSAGSSSVSTGSIAGAGNVAANAGRVADDATDESSQFPLREAVDEPQLTFISVEVLGFGEEEEES